MVDSKLFREAMARLGAAVNIITTNGSAGCGGFTASAVCSVTEEPPTLLVCVNRNANSSRLLKANGVLCVNTLSPGHEELSRIFSSSSLPPEERFKAGTWDTLVTGAPVLCGAVVSFDCRIAQATEVGTHSVLFAEIQAIRAGDLYEGLIYFGRSYHRVGAVCA